MRAIILAAGCGTRLKHLSEDRPKCLLELHGKTLLNRQLEALRESDIYDISIVTGYKREMLSGYGLKEFHNPRWAETNMVSSLVCASKWLEDESCIVTYSDIFYSSEAIKLLIKSDADIAVTYDPNWLKLWKNRFDDPLLDAETFRLNKDGTLAEIGNKPKTVEEIEGQYMGLLRFTPKGWGAVVTLRDNISRKQCDQMHMTETLGAIIHTNKISTIPYYGLWGEIDTIKDLEFAKESK